MSNANEEGTRERSRSTSRSSNVQVPDPLNRTVGNAHSAAAL